MRHFWPFLLLAALLASCVESEARLVWRGDGAMELVLAVQGEPVLLGELAPFLREQGFWVRAGEGKLLALRPLKGPGWDRLSGLLPGRFAYHDPSGVVLSRTSYLLFEDYRLSGRFVPLKVARLPAFLAPTPFRFVLEAPFPPRRANADRQEGRRLVWEGRLGDVFEVEAVYRLFYPERGLLLFVLLIIGRGLWRRLRRTRSG